MPTWKVKLIDEARNDFRKLDGSRKLLVAKQLVKLERDPCIGKPLGDKMGMDLTGYYKLYADKKRWCKSFCVNSLLLQPSPKR